MLGCSQCLTVQDDVCYIVDIWTYIPSGNLYIYIDIYCLSSFSIVAESPIADQYPVVTLYLSAMACGCGDVRAVDTRYHVAFLPWGWKYIRVFPSLGFVGEAQT